MPPQHHSPVLSVPLLPTQRRSRISSDRLSTLASALKLVQPSQDPTSNRLLPTLQATSTPTTTPSITLSTSSDRGTTQRLTASRETTSTTTTSTTGQVLTTSFLAIPSDSELIPASTTRALLSPLATNTRLEHHSLTRGLETTTRTSHTDTPKPSSSVLLATPPRRLTLRSRLSSKLRPSVVKLS